VSKKAMQAAQKKRVKDADLICMGEDAVTALQYSMTRIEEEEGVFMGVLAPEKRERTWSDI